MTGLIPLCHVHLISPLYQNINLCYIKKSKDKQMYKMIDKNMMISQIFVYIQGVRH